jgi:hypothetical protein
MSDAEERAMRISILGIVALFLVTGAQGSAQNPGTPNTDKCLHGADETRANRTRREKAVDMAHDINGAQQMARRFRSRPDQGGYRPLDQLTNVQPAPDGFRVQLNTDGSTYSFSIKDAMDPCLFAVFSDQSGDIYEATPTPDKARMRLLSQR